MADPQICETAATMALYALQKSNGG